MIKHDSIKEIIGVLTETNLNRIDFHLESNEEVTAYKVGHIIRIDVKVKQNLM